jgi:formylglycine-generating enzyme required for sulfatase activity
MKTLAVSLSACLALFALGGAKSAASAQPSKSAPGAVFRDCPDCPQMVVIPAGRFAMGSADAEKAWAISRGSTAESLADESPQHPVTLRAFALGRYDVTRGQYAAFVKATNYPDGDGCGPNGEQWVKQPTRSWRDPGFAQTDRDPVVCVSWWDAQSYIAWLNGKARGRGAHAGAYRLPTEAEWEYAARGGTTTPFWWGDDDDKAADYAWFGDRVSRPHREGNSGGRTHPVGSKPVNPFGLYDMAGNVWQWTADCYAESYADARPDGQAVETGADCRRADRGGSWLYTTWLLRPATRERNPPDYRDAVMGLRVARTLP